MPPEPIITVTPTGESGDRLLILDLPRPLLEAGQQAEDRVRFHIPSALLDSWVDYDDHARGLHGAGPIIRALANDLGCSTWNATEHRFVCSLCGASNALDAAWLEDPAMHHAECAWRWAKAWVAARERSGD